MPNEHLTRVFMHAVAFAALVVVLLECASLAGTKISEQSAVIQHQQILYDALWDQYRTQDTIRLLVQESSTGTPLLAGDRLVVHSNECYIVRRLN